jgi:prepilin-type N-terminal cleavage/methylation domain-containing protein
MRTECKSHPKAEATAASGFTLAETLVAILVFAVMATGLYAGFTSGFMTIQVARENLRATQILLERMETIRLYRWEQVTDDAFIPKAFTEYFYPDGLAAGAGGIAYTGMMAVASVPDSLPAEYKNDMRQATVRIGWVSGKVPHVREMKTYVARYGLQNYVYSPTPSP